jgi:hypothetical protein
MLRRRFRFGAAMKFWTLILFLIISTKIIAQERFVDGIVFDKYTKERIAEVNVQNITSGKSIYNSIKGEFKISAQLGDLLVFTRQNYRNDTLKIKSYSSLAVSMDRLSIQLMEVTIRDSLATPEEQLAATKRDYNKIYGSIADKDLLSVSPGEGAGLSIDALWNSFSREGRNATHLRETIQGDYYQNVIDYRFNRTLVARITGLRDLQLTDFMRKYRPGYYFVITASDYDFITSIKANLRRYLRRPRTYSLPALPSIPPLAPSPIPGEGVDGVK